MTNREVERLADYIEMSMTEKQRLALSVMLLDSFEDLRFVYRLAERTRERVETYEKGLV